MITRAPCLRTHAVMVAATAPAAVAGAAAGWDCGMHARVDARVESAHSLPIVVEAARDEAKVLNRHAPCAGFHHGVHHCLHDRLRHAVVVRVPTAPSAEGGGGHSASQCETM
jgi:hypothetical protein